MPARVSNATGNWSDATNWLTASNTWGTGTGQTLVNNTSRFTATFTAPSTSASCVGVAVYFNQYTTAAINLTIALQENSVDVATRTFALGSSDIPAYAYGWHFFRFTTPYQYTTTTANAYRFRLASDVAGANLYCLNDVAGTAYAFLAVDNRTGAVASTDDVFVLADVKSGQTKTITFDRNDSTVTCLSCRVGYNATLTFSRTMTTQMIIGNNTTSILGEVYVGGTFAIGTVANPIPAAYTATLVLDGNTIGTTSGQNGIYLYAGASGGPQSAFSAVGDPNYNARAKTVEGYDTGWYATQSANNVTAGMTTVVLNEDLGLRATGGDVISFSECDNSVGFGGNNEFRTTTAYNAATKTVTVSPAWSFQHNAGAIVNNVTRNVVIKPVNTARPWQLLIFGQNTYKGACMHLRHAQFESFNRITGNTFSYTPIGGTDIVGCSLHNPGNIAQNGFLAVVSGTRIINCHSYRFPFIQTGSPHNTVENSDWFIVTDCSMTMGAYFVNGYGILVKNCLISCSNWTQNNSYVRFENCIGADANIVASNMYHCEFYNCSVNTIGALQNYGGPNVFDNFRVNGFCGIIFDGTVNTDVVLRNSTFVNAPATRLTVNPALPNVAGSYRIGLIQNCSIPTYPSTFSVYMTGQMRRYTVAGAPQNVSPVPSGASVVNRFEQINQILQSWPHIATFRIPVPTGTQANTVRIPVYLSGWGASLPSNTELQLEMFAPGATVPSYSMTTVTANDQWQILTVTGTSTGQGYLIVRVLLKKYVANAVMYVDWPLGMDTSVMEWYDGRPNEYMILGKTTTALDAASDMSAAPLISPPKYAYGQDKKSLRIDGPGVREFTIRVTPKLHVLRIQARYDQYHGTTNKPQIIIKAEPELGLAQQTRTLSVGAEQWETEEFTFIPSADGVIVLQLVSRSATPWGGAWFDNFAIE